jgi:lipopolysaccharide export system protein LptA
MNRWIFFIITMSITIGASLSAQAQSLNFSSGDTPIEIDADNGIEWQQDGLMFVARGNARAVRGEVQILADELRAYYRKTTQGATEIWRLDAIGAVRIKSAEGTAFGDKALYDVDNSILTITGKNLKLISGQDWLTATDQLEYWEKKQMAYFRKNKKNEQRIYRVDAFDAVKVSAGKDEATSDRGVYNVESGIATLTGNVKIVRDKNVLNGCSANVNMNTGVSRLYSCATGNTRVKGRFLPKKKPRK